jgi:hypothetical protein
MAKKSFNCEYCGLPTTERPDKIKINGEENCHCAHLVEQHDHSDIMVAECLVLGCRCKIYHQLIDED